jgi:hypothetical protein
LHLVSAVALALAALSMSAWTAATDSTRTVVRLETVFSFDFLSILISSLPLSVSEFSKSANNNKQTQKHTAQVARQKYAVHFEVRPNDPQTSQASQRANTEQHE